MRIIGPKKLVKRAKFIAELLGINPSIVLEYTNEEESYSECYSNEDGSFKLRICSFLKKTDIELVESIGHEMIHVWQHMRGDLITMDNEHRWVWKGQMFVGSEDNMEEYYLRPWELEARAYEAWIGWRWRNK